MILATPTKGTPRMNPNTKNILQGIAVPAAVIALCAIVSPLLSGCSTLWNEEQANKAAEAISPALRKLAGTDELNAKFDAAEERANLAYAFSWLTAEKLGISETDARDWLANRNAAPDEEAEEAAPADVDAVDFALLQWKSGGVDGSKAKLDSPRLSGLRASASSISYTWDVGLDAWGLARDDAGALACLFVEKSDGSIVGGKFDWVSTSRSARGLENIYGGYSGWNLSDVPNPCTIYYVVVDKAGRRRSNVVTANWSR